VSGFVTMAHALPFAVVIRSVDAFGSRRPDHRASYCGTPFAICFVFLGVNSKVEVTAGTSLAFGPNSNLKILFFVL
jgi:hypothetical protein